MKGAPHPRFPVRLSGFRALHAPFLTERRTRGLVQAACRKFGASRSFFARCGIPPRQTGNSLDGTDRTISNRTGAPRSPKRTWAEKDGRSPTTALPQSSNNSIRPPSRHPPSFPIHTPQVTISICPMFKLDTLIDVVALVAASKRQRAVLWQDASGNWHPHIQ